MLTSGQKQLTVDQGLRLGVVAFKTMALTLQTAIVSVFVTLEGYQFSSGLYQA